jgi:hypothetical protein
MTDVVVVIGPGQIGQAIALGVLVWRARGGPAERLAEPPHPGVSHLANAGR